MDVKYEVNILVNHDNTKINHFVYFSKYENAAKYIKEHKAKGNKIISFREYVVKTYFDVDGEL